MQQGEPYVLNFRAELAHTKARLSSRAASASWAGSARGGWRDVSLSACRRGRRFGAPGKAIDRRGWPGARTRQGFRARRRGLVALVLCGGVEKDRVWNRTPDTILVQVIWFEALLQFPFRRREKTSAHDQNSAPGFHCARRVCADRAGIGQWITSGSLRSARMVSCRGHQPLVWCGESGLFCARRSADLPADLCHSIRVGFLAWWKLAVR